MFDAIPSGLKCLFKGNVNNDNVSLRSDIAIKGVTMIRDGIITLLGSYL